MAGRVKGLVGFTLVVQEQTGAGARVQLRCNALNCAQLQCLQRA